MTSDMGRHGQGEEESLSFAEVRRYLEAPRRRPLMVVVPWAAVLLASVVALFMIPKKYKSSTMILVESEKMPDSFVPKVATDDRRGRLEAVRPEILSRTRLENVLESTNPYPDTDSRIRGVELMRSNIYINVTGNDGFTIDYVHSDPKKAQEVCDRLANLFIGETIKSREQQVEGAVDFLVTQVDAARKELERKDEALRRYKEIHMGKLPEQLQTNLATMGMLQRELQTVEESLLFARERQQSLQLSGRAAAPAEGAPGPGGELAELRRQLTSMRGRYTDEHPDVQRLRSRLARLEARAAESAGAPADAGTQANSEQLTQARNEITRLEEKRRDLEARIGGLRANVENTPRTEQDLATLTRDYDKLKENYSALLSKQMEAQMAGRLEQRWKGDRFRMLDPASLPERPFFPKPLVVVGLGAMLGLFLGLAAAVLAEFLDSTIKDPQDLMSVQAHPVLACIPHLPAVGEPAPRRPGAPQFRGA
jgi:succinoglycan biosynthesis transport protein ExoP